MSHLPPSPPLPGFAALNQTFEPLRRHAPWLRHGFTLRVPGIDVSTDRESALRRLADAHRSILAASGVARPEKLLLVEQVHGAVARTARNGAVHAAGADALCANEPGALIGIYVADCGPLWIVDPIRRAVGLAHSGRKGTELNIAAALIREMRESFGSVPGDLEAFLGPCIRPPNYETDFAAAILGQCRAEGVNSVSDCGLDTAADLAAYYSYRAEKGRTGRMLAWAEIVPHPGR